VYGPSQKLKAKIKFKNTMKVIHTPAKICIQESSKLFCVLHVNGYNKTFILILKHLVKYVVDVYAWF
jgi:hypothetical protein